jgi:hypothetical protein
MLSRLIQKINLFLKKRSEKKVQSILVDEMWKLKPKNNSNLTLRNCQFNFKCSQTWEGLEETGLPGVRNCKECSSWVYIVKTDKELVKAIKSNKCVAIKRPKHKQLLVGMIEGVNYDKPTYQRKMH